VSLKQSVVHFSIADVESISDQMRLSAFMKYQHVILMFRSYNEVLKRASGSGVSRLMEIRPSQFTKTADFLSFI